MSPLLAQLTGNPPPPPGFTDWLQSATYLVWLGGGVVVLWRHLRKPSAMPVDVENKPLTVAPATAYVKKPDYDHDQGVLDRRLNAATEARKGIHEKLDQHGQRLALLEKGERHTEAALADIDQKLTTILQRLPTIKS